VDAPEDIGSRHELVSLDEIGWPEEKGALWAAASFGTDPDGVLAECPLETSAGGRLKPAARKRLALIA
jgi:hypothetical protein